MAMLNNQRVQLLEKPSIFSIKLSHKSILQSSMAIFLAIHENHEVFYHG